MPKPVSEFLAVLVEVAWGLPLVFLLIGGGIYLLFVSRFLSFKGFGHALKLTFGKYKHAGQEKAAGQISHFQALSNALAATVGMGNIAGVAVAIHMGGPGAVFWMWVAALIGMNTKFFECALSVMYRGRDYRGEVQGGPMFVIGTALGKHWKPLAVFFAVCGLVGTLTLFNVNQLASYLHDQYQVPPIWVGMVCAVLTAYILRGGLPRLARTTSALVPLMCLLYVLAALVILALNIEKIPAVFAAIFREAFSGRAAVGGAAAIGMIEVLKIGVRRAAFSNEAGIGTSPMAHSNVKTPEPVTEGFVAMLEPFCDTILICTMTALVILVSVEPGAALDGSGVVLTTRAFAQNLPGFGVHFLGVAVLLFSFSTIIGYANYNEKCWNFLFKGRWGLTENVFIVFYCSSLILGAVSALGDIVNLLDCAFAFMAVPNMLATLALAPRVKKVLEDYVKKYLVRKSEPVRASLSSGSAESA